MASTPIVEYFSPFYHQQVHLYQHPQLTYGQQHASQQAHFYQPQLQAPIERLTTRPFVPSLEIPSNYQTSSLSGSQPTQPESLRTAQSPNPIQANGITPISPLGAGIPSEQNYGPTSAPKVLDDDDGGLSAMPLTENKFSSMQDESHAQLRRPSDSGPSLQRRDASNMVIACQQCRQRKIKCDSTRPKCNNCIRRQNTCVYDAIPKRRGPDKRPGTRQRSCKKKPTEGAGTEAPAGIKQGKAAQRSAHSNASTSAARKPRLVVQDVPLVHETTTPDAKELRIETDPAILGKSSAGSYSEQNISSSLKDLASPPSTSYDYSAEPIMQLPLPGSASYPDAPTPYASSGYYSPASHLPSSHAQSASDTIDSSFAQDASRAHPQFLPPPAAAEPSLRLWWNDLFKSYSLDDVVEDITFLHTTAASQFSVINLGFLLQNISSPTCRLSIQPSLIYILLAHSNFLRSCEGQPYAANRRARASWLRDAAGASLVASWNSEPSTDPATWVDGSLATTAYLISLYESSAHENYRPERVEASLRLLDTIIDRLGLLKSDSTDHDVVVFSQSQAPSVPVEQLSTAHATSATSALAGERRLTCQCTALEGAVPANPYVTRTFPLVWPSTFNPIEIRQEEIRRVCWGALDLVSRLMVSRVAFGIGLGASRLSDAGVLEGLWTVGRAENYALLFPGEEYDRTTPAFTSPDSLAPKESIWALYCRSMLLWHYTTRLAHSQDQTSEIISQKHRQEDLAELSLDIWTESQAIEDSLNAHVCNLDTSLIYCSREYVFNTRMTVAQVLRSFHGLGTPVAPPPGPMFSRKQAESWLYYQDVTVKRVTMSLASLNDVPSSEVTRRPVIVPWFLNQLVICLILWQREPTLTNALELGKSIISLLDTLIALWPSTYLRHQTKTIRHRITEACHTIGVPPPDPSPSSPPSTSSIPPNVHH